MTTTLTESEAKYIVAMFKDDTPEIKGIKKISELPIPWVGMFMENREQEPKTIWPDDHTICEKYLTFHKLPLTMTYKEWKKWAEKHQRLSRS